MTPEFEEYLRKRQAEDEARRKAEDAEGEEPPEITAEDESILDKAWEGVADRDSKSEG